MAILNITPDSFSDGGELFSSGKPDLDTVLYRAEQVVEEGADVFDIGGESTRPRAAPVSSEQECERVLPVFTALKKHFDLPISVDTSNPVLMVEAGRAGAAMINDVRALERDGAIEAVASSDMAVCLMHMQGQPSTMQLSPEYENVTDEVSAYLQSRLQACEAAGIKAERVVLDPGFGFGKTLAHNIHLFNHIEHFVSLDCPVLIGVSRKSMIGSILSKGDSIRPEKERVVGGVALALIAAQKGAAIIRTHDVLATCDALDVLTALSQKQ